MTNDGITDKTLAALLGIDLDEFRKTAWSPIPGTIGHKRRYGYSDALRFEIARQLHISDGIPFAAALRLLIATLHELNSDTLAKTDGDVWIGAMGSRILSGDKDVEVAEAYFSGTLAGITSKIDEWIEVDRAAFPDALPARIFLANVSTADRRLRRRAVELGITFDDD